MNEAQRNEKLRDWKSQKGIPKDLEKRKEDFF